MADKYIIHTDGGSRGNPGPAAIGFVIEGEGLKKEHGEYIGEATNNVAEYKAVIFALKKLKALVGKEKAFNAQVEVHMDSELLARQINGEFKIENPEMQKLFLELWNLKVEFRNIKFVHIFRESNHGADKMVNRALDKEGSRMF